MRLKGEFLASVRGALWGVAAYTIGVVAADLVGRMPDHPADWFLRIPLFWILPILVPFQALTEGAKLHEYSPFVRYLVFSFYGCALAGALLGLWWKMNGAGARPSTGSKKK